MNSKTKTCLVLSGVLSFSAVAMQAQRHGPDGPPFGAPMELMGFEGMHGGKLVKGAPFSATATAETTETLQDGSLIHRTSQVTMYRDSQGRSRHEVTLTGVGPLTASGTPKKMISISDPVAGVHIMLDNDQKVAHKSAIRTHEGNGSSADSAANFESRMQEREQKEIAAGLLKKESLGTQTISGIMAEGTRTTRTIPAGEIGNEKALQIVSERWVSDRPANPAEEHADRSAVGYDNVYRDQHSEDGAGGHVVYSAGRFHGAGWRRPWARRPRARRSSANRLTDDTAGWELLPART